MGARIYNASLSRFHQPDPLPAQESIADTAYSYASNDPINRIDPTGEASRAQAEVDDGTQDSCRQQYLNLRFVKKEQRIHAKGRLKCDKRNENRRGEFGVLNLTNLVCQIGNVNPGSNCATVYEVTDMLVLWSWTQGGTVGKWKCGNKYGVYMSRYYIDPDDLDSVSAGPYFKAKTKKAPKCKK